jgi:hypothetical protein
MGGGIWWGRDQVAKVSNLLRGAVSTRLTRPHVDAHIGRFIIVEGNSGSRKERIRAGILLEDKDHQQGPCETDDVTRADSGGSAAKPVTGRRQRAMIK